MSIACLFMFFFFKIFVKTKRGYNLFKGEFYIYDTETISLTPCFFLNI